MIVHALVAIENAQPMARRSFKAFKGLNAATRFITQKGSGKLHKVQYGSDKRDVRYIVNYRGR